MANEGNNARLSKAEKLARREEKLAAMTPEQRAKVGEKLAKRREAKRAARSSQSREDESAEALAHRFKRLVKSGKFGEAQLIQSRLWDADPALQEMNHRTVPLLAWNREFAPAEHNRFIFVSGAPRSGTSALGQLLNTCQDVAIYTELFAHRYGYLPAMFASANIAALRARGLLETFDMHTNAEIHKWAQTATAVGDKRPNFMNSVELTLANFANRRMTIVHIVRNIHDVAVSWVVKGQWAGGGEEGSHAGAVRDMTMNNRAALKLLNHLAPPHDLIVLDYQRLWSSPHWANALFERLEFDPSRIKTETVQKIYEKSAVIFEKPRVLSQDMRDYIEQHYDFTAERRLLDAAMA